MAKKLPHVPTGGGGIAQVMSRLDDTRSLSRVEMKQIVRKKLIRFLVITKVIMAAAMKIVLVGTQI